jgi:hypothetical protein
MAISGMGDGGALRADYGPGRRRAMVTSGAV